MTEREHWKQGRLLTEGEEGTRTLTLWVLPLDLVLTQVVVAIAPVLGTVRVILFFYCCLGKRIVPMCLKRVCLSEAGCWCCWSALSPYLGFVILMSKAYGKKKREDEKKAKKRVQATKKGRKGGEMGVG